MNEELGFLPCPACGGKAMVHIYDRQVTFPLRCQSCGMQGPAPFVRESFTLTSDLIDEAVCAWNSLPRALTWTTEPPKETGHYWCRYTGSDKATWAPAYIPAVGDLRSYDMEKHEKIEWAGPIPMPKEPTP